MVPEDLSKWAGKTKLYYNGINFVTSAPAINKTED